ncbi:MAG TPA: hypothetical protein VGO56_14815 [Pyrinomonadaceae bacterium]|jgi:hypothetical protein|nr:hypothetical protein [Pyrinomonadaceae bacterium]
MTKVRIMAFVASLLILSANVSSAQEPASQVTPTSAQTEEQQQKEKEAAEKQATALLEQIVGEVQMLRLPENRIRVQIAAADMLWKRNESRARSMFSLAGDGLAEVMRSTDNGSQRWAGQLRQELVLTAAQHDAPLAYQLLATTQSLSPPAETAGNFRRPSPDADLEQTLLARVAATDPKLAAQKVEEALAGGQYPGSLPQVLAALQSQDKDAASKLTAKVVSKLQSENMPANQQAAALALTLLRSGPAPPPVSSAAPSVVGQSSSIRAQPVLGETAFQNLMNTVIDAALRTTRQPANTTGGGNNGRGRGNFGAQQSANQSAPTDGQIEQQNGRRLLSGLQMLLPQIDQYLPARGAAVRNKMTELGMSNNSRMGFDQISTLMQQGTADTLLAAAPSAPAPLQSRLYQQAAQKALDEGNADRARQIANDHLDATTRDRVLQKVDFQVTAKKVQAQNFDELRQTLASLHSDDERIDLLLQLADQAQEVTKDEATANTNDQRKLALSYLNEAQRLVNRRATNYGQFEQQLRVADAFATVEPPRSFEVLDPGISQINELLSAAALLSGFEVNIFRDGEMPLEGGSGLSDMVKRYGQELGQLAKLDFARAESSASKFQLAEPRLMTQLAIVRSVLGVPQAAPANNGFGFGGRFGRRGQ